LAIEGTRYALGGASRRLSGGARATAIGLVLACAGSVIVVTVFWEQAMALVLGSGLASFEELSTAQDRRLGYWVGGVRDWWEGGGAAAIFGSGFHSTSGLTGDSWRTTHNLYITLLGDFGLVGLLLLVAAVVVYYGAWGRALRRGHTDPEVTGYVIAVSALLLHNLSEVFLYSPMYVSLLVILVLLTRWRIRALEQQQVEQQAPTDPTRAPRPVGGVDSSHLPPAPRGRPVAVGGSR
jgi:O-antigen ligase